MPENAFGFGHSGETLIEAVAKAKSVNIRSRELRLLNARDRRDKIAQATAEEWQTSLTSADIPTPEAVIELSKTLLGAARSKANYLPESFPFRYLERRLAALKRLTTRDWPPEAEMTGEYIVDLSEFITILASLPHDMSEAIDACGRTGQALGEMLGNIKQPGDALCWNVLDASWPAGAAAELRSRAAALIETAGPL